MNDGFVRMMSFVARHVCTGMVVVGLLAPAVSIAADPVPTLVVRRSPEALDCPDATSLAAAVELQMKRPAITPASTLDAAASASIEVNVARDQSGYTASMQAGGRVRQLSDTGPTCAGLAEGLAITLAIMLDADDEPASPVPPIPAPPSILSPAPTVPRAAASMAKPRLVVQERSTHLTVHAEVGGSAGLIGSADVAMFGEASLDILRSLKIGVGALWLPTRTIEFTPGTVDIGLVAGALRVCVDVAQAGTRSGIRFSLCALGFGGALEGKGAGYPINGEQLRGWTAVGVGALIEGSLWRRIGWSARVNFVVPLIQESLRVDGYGVAFAPMPIGGFATFGPRLSIW